MGFRPGGPEEGNIRTGGSGGNELCIGGGEVAGDCGGCEVSNGAVSSCREGPDDAFGDWGHVGVLEDEIAGVVGVVDGEVLDDAVGGGEDGGTKGGEDGGLHGWKEQKLFKRGKRAASSGGFDVKGAG